MNRFAPLLAFLAAAFLAGAAGAQPPSVGDLFDAAERGELAPVARALDDPATGADLRVLLRAELAAARFDPAAGRDPALARLAAESRDPALRQAALAILTETAFANGDFAGAARSGRANAQALAAAGRAAQAAGAGRTWRLAALLAGRPAQSVAGIVVPASIAARRDGIGLTRIEVTVNGVVQETVVDTGANLSALSASTARRLGVVVIEGEGAVGNGVAGTVPVRLGVAARLDIAGTTLTNVVFLILDDAALTFPVPGGYDIPAIVGLPVLRALGRVRIEAAGRFAVLAPAAASGGGPNLHASGSDLFVDVEIDGRPVPLHLDSGANQTSLSALYAAANRAAIARLAPGEARSASAGGARREAIAAWPDAPLALAGRSLTVPTLAIALPGEGPAPRTYGTLGSDVLQRFASYTIDFAAMRLELGEPVAAAGH